jgi:hypothetical protein
MPKEKNAWGRLPGERARAYGYAWDYFMLGPQRSIEKVIQNLAKKLQPLQKPPSAGTLKNLSSKWRWSKRGKAYDQWIEGKNLAAAEVLAVEDAKKRVEDERESRESDREIARLVREQVKNMLKYPLSEQKIVSERYEDGREKVIHLIKPARWGKGDIPRLLQSAKTLDGAAIRNEGVNRTEKLNDVLNLVDYEPARKGAKKK